MAVSKHITVTDRAGTGGSQIALIPVFFTKGEALTAPTARFIDSGIVLPSSLLRVASAYEDGSVRVAQYGVQVTFASTERILSVELGGVAPPAPIAAPSVTADMTNALVGPGLQSLHAEVARTGGPYDLKVEGTAVVLNPPAQKIVKAWGTFINSTASSWVGGDSNAGRPSGTPSPPRNQVIQWTAWGETFSGVNGMVIKFRLENAGGASFWGTNALANDTRFDSFKLVFGLPESVGSALTVDQRHIVVNATDETPNFSYIENGITHGSSRHPGEFQFANRAMAVKWFWEQYPSLLEASGSTIKLRRYNTPQTYLGIWSHTQHIAIAPTVAEARALLLPPAVHVDPVDIRHRIHL